MDKPVKMKTIRINWQINKKSDSATPHYTWPNTKIVTSSLDNKLSWPDGTLNIITKAFEASLDRKTPWDLSQIKNKEPFKFASAIFKRGVSLTNSPDSNEYGEYDIQVCDFKPDIIGFDCAVIDKNVCDLWKIEKDSRVLEFIANEKNKSLESVALIVKHIQHTNTKHVAIIGGGITTDVAAFACYITGIKFTLIPTTLLAMVDASVGGKTGVNFIHYGKNQIGSFTFPKKVICWPGWLSTLHSREINAGLSEVAKHALLSGDLDMIVPFIQDKTSSLNESICRAIHVKSSIVEKDPIEKSERATLNLGHTLAHALEQLSAKRSLQPINHGEAVGIGLLFSLILSRTLKIIEVPDFDQAVLFIFKSEIVLSQYNLTKRLGVDSLITMEVIDEIYNYLLCDKKNRDAQVHWVLLEKVGVVHKHLDSFTVPVSRHHFEKAYKQLPSYLS